MKLTQKERTALEIEEENRRIEQETPPCECGHDDHFEAKPVTHEFFKPCLPTEVSLVGNVMICDACRKAGHE